MAATPDALQPIRALVTTPDLADDPNIFPRLPGMKFVDRGTQWRTTSLEATSGRVFKTKRWTEPRNHFTAKFEGLNQEPNRRDLDRLDAFFNARAGANGNFYYWDPERNLVKDLIIGVGDGNTRLFQLKRAVRAYTERVYAIVGAPKLKANWQPVSNFTVLDLAVILFDTPPALGVPISWSGSYLFWCEFMQDDLSVEQMNNHLFSQGGLAFRSIKL